MLMLFVDKFADNVLNVPVIACLGQNRPVLVTNILQIDEKTNKVANLFVKRFFLFTFF